MAQSFLFAHGEGEHGAGAQFLHPAAPLGDQFEGVLQGEDSGHAGRGEFAHTVADQGFGFEPPGQEETRQGDFESDDGRLGDVGSPEEFLGLAHRGAFAEEARPKNPT